MRLSILRHIGALVLWCSTLLIIAHASEAPHDWAEIKAYSSDGRSLATLLLRQKQGSNRYSEQLEVWDTSSGKSRFRPQRIFNQSIQGAALSPDGHYLVIGVTMPQSSDAKPDKRGEWMLWDVIQKRLLRRGIVPYGWILNVKFSPTGDQFALDSQHENSTGEYDGSKIFIVEAASGKTLRTYRTGWSTTYSMAFSPDGRTLGICGEIRLGQILYIRRQPPLGIVQLWDAHSERLEHTFIQIDCSLSGLTFSPQSDVIVCVRSLNNRALLDEQIRAIEPDNTMASKTSGTVVTEATREDLRRDIVAWNLRTGKSALWQGSSKTPDTSVDFDHIDFRLTPDGRGIHFQFSPDGRTLSGLMLVTKPDPDYPKDSHYVETLSVIRTWKIDDTLFDTPSSVPSTTTQVLEESRLTHYPLFSPDGTQVIGPDNNGIIHFWDSATARLIDRSWQIAP